MRRLSLFCLTLTLFAASPLLAQPDSLWSRTYGGSGFDYCMSLLPTADGGYALAGHTNSFGAGDTDFWLLRTDENGDSLWSHTYGGLGEDYCYSLIQTADGGFALAGETHSFGAEEENFWLLRTNENGDSLWSRVYGSSGHDGCQSLIQTMDGGFALAGWTNSFGSGRLDFWLVRTDENGDSLWSRTFGGEDHDLCTSLVQTADGGFALAGDTWSFGAGGYDFWLIRTSENGDSLWSHTYGGLDVDRCCSLVQTADRGYALVGWTDSFGAGISDSWLVRTDENGDSLWSRTYGGESGDGGYSLIQTSDVGFALAGGTYSFGAGGNDFWLVRTDENGDSLWSRSYGGESEDVCWSLVQTADRGYALAGLTSSFGAGANDFWLIKLGPENSVPDAEATTPLQFGLDAVYPNPFNSQAVSSYKLQVTSQIELGLYDLSGRLVQTLAEGWQEAGSHQAVIDGTQLPSGVYLLKLTDGKQSALSKVCLLK